MTLDPRPPWPGHSRLLSGQLSSSELKVIISSSSPFPSLLSPYHYYASLSSSLSLVSTLHSPLAGSWQPAVRIVFGISFGVISLLLLVSAAPCQHAPFYHNGQAAACPAYLHPYRRLLAKLWHDSCSAMGLMISVCIAHFMHNFRKFHCGFFAADVELLFASCSSPYFSTLRAGHPRSSPSSKLNQSSFNNSQ